MCHFLFSKVNKLDEGSQWYPVLAPSWRLLWCDGSLSYHGAQKEIPLGFLLSVLCHFLLQSTKHISQLFCAFCKGTHLTVKNIRGPNCRSVELSGNSVLPTWTAPCDDQYVSIVMWLDGCKHLNEAFVFLSSEQRSSVYDIIGVELLLLCSCLAVATCDWWRAIVR